MVESDIRRDPLFQQSFKGTLIVVDALFVELSRTFGQHARPGKRHTVAVHTKRFEVGKIARKKAMIAVASGQEVFSAHDLPARGKGIPDARAPAIICGAALDLGCSRRNAPQKILRISHRLTSMEESAESVLSDRPRKLERSRRSPVRLYQAAFRLPPP